MRARVEESRPAQAMMSGSLNIGTQKERHIARAGESWGWVHVALTHSLASFEVFMYGAYLVIAEHAPGQGRQA